MPIYEYRCDDCGHELEALQKVSDAPLAECPACGGATLRKRISAAGFRLKGAGWYETDFKQGNKKNLHDKGDRPAGEASKGDAKPAEKAPAASVKPQSKPAAAAGTA